MPLLNWYKIYSVNNEEIDSHHKTLFDIFNRLYKHCIEKCDVDIIDKIIDELISYSEYHFKAEEQYMIDVGYVGIEKHIVEHKYFTEKVLEFKQNLKNVDFEICKNLIVFLGNWLIHHVVEEDKKIAL